MKIIFLDIDGVLNSEMYKSSHMKDENDNYNYIDSSRVKLLADIVKATDAKIVLSSSLRTDWDKADDRCSKNGIYIKKSFAEYGLTITDKTPYISFFTERRKEILIWLSNHLNDVESFVILDDMDYGWKQLNNRVVITNPQGYGLEEVHVKKAIELLNVSIKFKH